MKLFGTPSRAAQLAARAALLSGAATVGAGRAVTGAVVETAAGAESAARTAVRVVVEALGGPPARRRSAHDGTHWIEVRGLGSDDGHRIGAGVLAALQSTPGVDTAALNVATARAVVVVAEDGPTAAELCRLVDEAESRVSTTPARTAPLSLPGDDEVLAARLLAAAIAAVGVAPAAIGAALRLGHVGDIVAAPLTLLEHTPRLRRRIEQYLGPDATDLAFALLTTTTGVLTASPTAILNQAATRAVQAAETVDARRSWRRHQAALTVQALRSASETGDLPRGTVRFPAGGAAERYADRAATVGLGTAGLIGLASRHTATAASAAVVATARPVRGTREAFAYALHRGLADRHGALVLRRGALRTLDKIDTVVIDQRVLYTDELTISRVRDVDDSRRTRAWEAALAALADGALAPGWHRLSTIPGAGDTGEALVSPVRDPFASAVVTEARRVGARVVSLDDDGLRSLGQGFDELRPTAGTVDEALAEAVSALRTDAARVALVTSTAERAALNADVTVGVWRDGSPPPWAADILVPDLPGVWRVLHALPAARHAATKGIEFSASGSVLGALMLIPGVNGSGPGAGNLAALAALWTGHRIGNAVFDEHLPRHEPRYDWHALPVEEVRRLLPRPHRDTTHAGRQDPISLTGPLRPVVGAAARSWHLVGDFVTAIRDDLADPITPILATGAAASALLGSPLDAVLVASVLLLNTAISAEQTLHAERILGRLLAGQTPLARRLSNAENPDNAMQYEDVPADELLPGDLIEVRVGEVVPADVRLVVADAAEADESVLTGESLPVAKSVDATPGASLAERACMLHAGTTLITGRATAVVTTTGAGMQINRASAMTARKSRKVGLQAQLAHITRRALPWSLAGGGIVGVLSLLRGTPLREAVAGGVAIAVAAVPEGLPLVATLAQSAAARQLTSSSVLIRNPRAIEAFARLDVVCFDKTGTLSQNRLQVNAVRPVAGADDRRVLEAAVHTVRPVSGHRADHATDHAVQLAAAELGLAPGGTRARLPFQSNRPYAGALTGTRLSVKGSPEAVMSALADSPDSLTPLTEEMTADGLRVLAVAERELTEEQVVAAAADPARMAELCESELTPLGAIGIADTPRPGARPLLEELQSRGLGVRLITGDHPVTAAVVAHQLGLATHVDQVMTGSEWELLTTEGRAEAVRTHQVFARMAPEHKVQVVQALESADLVTAMVGDGANDAAAIRAATVGVGVVSAGSDPARTAADVLLLDGEIGAFVHALDEGEQLWRRVRSSVSMLVGHNIGEVSFALLTSLLMGRPALNARQILLINMLTDALPAAALAVSPQTGDSVPDHHDASLWRAIWMRGASTATGGTLAWAFGRVTGTPRRAATMGLIGLVLTQMGQTLTDSHGPLVVLTNIGTLAVMAALISMPGISHLFGCTPVGPIGWIQAATAATIAGVLPKLAPAVVDRIATSMWSALDDATSQTNEGSAGEASSRR